MSVDDPDSYHTEPFQELTRIGRALRLFAAGDDALFAYGDGEVAAAWLMTAQAYDDFARVLAWSRAEEALRDNPDDPGLRSAYDAATVAARDPERAESLLDGSSVLTPEEFAAAGLVERVRAGSLQPTVVGREAKPEAVLISHDLCLQLQWAELRWRQSDAFMATLDPAVHKPLAESIRVDLDEFFGSLGPRSASVWDEVNREDGSSDR